MPGPWAYIEKRTSHKGSCVHVHANACVHICVLIDVGTGDCGRQPQASSSGTLSTFFETLAWKSSTGVMENWVQPWNLGQGSPKPQSPHSSLHLRVQRIRSFHLIYKHQSVLPALPPSPQKTGPTLGGGETDLLMTNFLSLLLSDIPDSGGKWISHLTLRWR